MYAERDKSRSYAIRVVRFLRGMLKRDKSRLYDIYE